MNTQTDVIMIGGGPAGLTAALALARIGREVIIFDDNNGRNFPADHMNNFPSRDGTPPREFKEQVIRDLRKYTEVTLRAEKVTDIKKTAHGFLINNHFGARKIIMAHGVRDLLPEIPGISDLWGKSVFHCPYCHGHEFKREKIGVLNSDLQYLSHMVPLLLGLSPDITIFTNGEALELPDYLKHVKVNHSKILRLKHDGPILRAIETSDGQVPMDGFVIKPPQKLTTELGVNLGCELSEFNLYKVDADFMTTVSGIYAAGDVAEARQSVLLACASGMRAAASISYALMKEKLLS